MTETLKQHALHDVFRLVFNENDAFSSIAIHAGEGLNHHGIRYFAENLGEVWETQIGQSVTLGHTVAGVGTVSLASWHPEGDEFGPFLMTRIKIQNHPEIVEAIKNKDIREVSTTTISQREFCTICNLDYTVKPDGVRVAPCSHKPGQRYDTKLCEIGVIVANFGPLALVEKGADVHSVILNQFTTNASPEPPKAPDAPTTPPTATPEHPPASPPPSEKPKQPFHLGTEPQGAGATQPSAPMRPEPAKGDLADVARLLAPGPVIISELETDQDGRLFAYSQGPERELNVHVDQEWREKLLHGKQKTILKKIRRETL